MLRRSREEYRNFLFSRFCATGSYGGEKTPLRRERSYTSNEKKKAVEFWETHMFANLRPKDEVNKFRHYTHVEEVERQKELERERNEPQLNIGSRKSVPIGATWRTNASDDSEPGQQRDDDLKHKVVDNLVKAERRVKFGADFGSLMLMAHLNEGLQLINEAEEILQSNKWLTLEMSDRIDELRRLAAKVKFDLDID